MPQIFDNIEKQLLKALASPKRFPGIFRIHLKSVR